MEENLKDQNTKEPEKKELEQQQITQPEPKQQQQSPQQLSSDKKGLAIAAFVLGFLAFIPVIGVLFAIIGLILGIVGLKSSAKGLAIVGIILCVIALVVSILLGVVFLKGLSKASVLAKDVKIEFSMSKIIAQAEIFHATKGTYIGFKKDKSFRNIQEEIEKEGGTNLALNVSKSKYCAEVRLNNKKWWCVDKDSNADQYDNNPTCSRTHFACE